MRLPGSLRWPGHLSSIPAAVFRVKGLPHGHGGDVISLLATGFKPQTQAPILQRCIPCLETIHINFYQNRAFGGGWGVLVFCIWFPC